MTFVHNFDEYFSRQSMTQKRQKRNRFSDIFVIHRDKKKFIQIWLHQKHASLYVIIISI